MRKQLTMALAALAVESAVGITICVCPPGQGANNPPYTNWADASTNIIEAVNSASDGDVVLVTNGTYILTNQINVVQNITMQSVNGCSNTLVNGNYPNVTNRCFYVTNAGCVVNGFTITNGALPSGGSGGGVYLVRGTVKNCLIVNNTIEGGGVNGLGAGLYIEYGTLTNSVVMRNGGARSGGGAYLSRGYVYNCQFSENTNTPLTGAAGIRNKYGVVYDTVISDNYGYGMSIENNAFALRCIISGNTFMGLYFMDANAAASVKGCLVVSNEVYGIRIYNGTGCVENCTVVDNNIGVCATGAVIHAASFLNTIIADSTSGTNWFLEPGKTFFTNCCTTPLVTNGPGNIDSPPLFQNAVAGNYRLAGSSPCINAGLNQNWMTNAVDLDGRIRIRYRAVDIGAYEGMHEGTIYIGF
ncbi:MAG: right-handed parallel beta-helix repeat-containing protein [Kiritimatiellae bacterium]|nr:right-handed parallel beta-helix repeat-containing protein [Kiritimatiellia bacterium]